MNIVFIMSDEHSGSAIYSSGDRSAVTPAIDWLAEHGMTFSQAYTPCPLCVPARASWFTGRYVCRLGTWDNSTPYDGKVLGIAEHLASYGIPVHQIGKTHFHCDGEYHFAGADNLGLLKTPDLGCYYRDDHVVRIGAEKRFEEVGIGDGSQRFDDRVLESTLQWLDEHRQAAVPWVLQVGFIEPHFPFQVRQENWDYFETLFESQELPREVLPPYTSLNDSLRSLRHYFFGEMATEDIMRKIRIGYYAAIKELDEKIGRILNKLEQLGMLNDTMIVYTSDHGEQLGYHGLWWKCCMFEQSARIPMIVALPKARRSAVAEPVSLTDVFPTFCDALNIPLPEHIDGQSFWPLLVGGPDTSRRDFAFSEFNAHGIPGGMFMIRWKQYKYVFFTDDDPQLFNLDEDPFENHDLIQDRSSSFFVAEIVEACHERLLSVCDPFEVTDRAKAFQQRMKHELGLPDEYVIGRGGPFVPHPDYLEIPQ